MLNCAIRNDKLIQLFVWVGNFTFIKEFNSIKGRKGEDNIEQLPLPLSTDWFFIGFLRKNILTKTI